MTDTPKQQSTACIVCCDVPCDCTCHKAADNQNKHEISGITADETDSLGRPTIESLLEVQADLQSQITDLERSLQEARSHIRELSKGDPEAAELVLSRIVQRLDTVVEEGVWPEKVEMAVEEICAELTLMRARITDLESEQAAALVMAADLLAEATRLRKRLAGGL